MAKLYQIRSYFHYWLNAVDKYSLQAPYVYAFYNEVIRNKADHPDFRKIEGIRNDLIESIQMIPVVDYGAGSQISRNKARAVREIAAKGITKEKYSQLLYRLCNKLQARNIVELGTSLGINTLYLSTDKNAKVSTFEGSPALIDIAQNVFKALDRKNIEIIEGNIDKVLTGFIEQSGPIDVAFIDANHRFTPTLNYFKMLLTKAHGSSCFIFDDIHWSKDMERAWEEIKKDPHVSLSIDLYQVGLVFFNPDLRKQHYVINF